MLDRQLLEIEPERLDATKNLATVYYDEGKYSQAEALFSRAVEIGRRMFGPEHPETTNAMYHLAAVYGEEGKYAQADLALAYVSQGKFAEAEPVALAELVPASQR